MRIMTVAGTVLILFGITTNAEAQDICDCAHFPWKPPQCREICTNRVWASLDSESYTYTEAGEFPRANFMAKDAAELVYDQDFPTTEYGFPVLSSTLYNDPERFGWTDVSALPSKEGAIAVWPTMSGFVVNDDTEDPAASQGDIRVLYPSHIRGGVLTIGNVRWLGEGAAPKFIVPTSALTGR